MDERHLASAKRVSTLALRDRRRKVVRQLPDLQQILRGSLLERFLTCGKPGCKCARGERHGPVTGRSFIKRSLSSWNLQSFCHE